MAEYGEVVRNGSAAVMQLEAGLLGAISDALAKLGVDAPTRVTIAPMKGAELREIVVHARGVRGERPHPSVALLADRYVLGFAVDAAPAYFQVERCVVETGRDYEPELTLQREILNRVQDAAMAWYKDIYKPGFAAGAKQPAAVLAPAANDDHGGD